MTSITSNRGSVRRVLVIGAGVSGLTSALCLKRNGFDVTIVADQVAPQVTSVVAGALWEWPPAVCGHHQDQFSLERSKVWSETSYEVFADLARDPTTGVYMRPVTFYFQRPIRENEVQWRKMTEISGKVSDLRHDATMINENGVNRNLGFQDAYSYLSPMIDTDVYMQWLMTQVEQIGCQLIRDRITGSLREQAADLHRRYNVEAIVNCTGLGAAELTGDSMMPLRGALIRLRNDGKTMPPIRQAHCVSATGSGENQTFIFIVPRGNDVLVLGGLAEPNEWSLDINLQNYEPVREILRRCVEFLPILSGAEIDATEPVRCGLRPLRPRNVRLELEAGTRTIHNYGHGGSGVTFSWGCSNEVTKLALDL